MILTNLEAGHGTSYNLHWVTSNPSGYDGESPGCSDLLTDCYCLTLSGIEMAEEDGS